MKTKKWLKRVLAVALCATLTGQLFAPGFTAKAGTTSNILVSENFEDNTIGAYPISGSDTITGAGAGGKTVKYESTTNTNKVFEFADVSNGGYQSKFAGFAFKEGNELSFDLRMPTVQANTKFGMLENNHSWNDLHFYVGTDTTKATLRLNNKVIAENVITVGENAPWYTVKLYLTGEISDATMAVKIWERGTQEPATYQYTASSIISSRAFDTMALAVSYGTVEIDNILVLSEPEIIVTGEADDIVPFYLDGFQHVTTSSFKTGSDPISSEEYTQASSAGGYYSFAMTDFKGQKVSSFDKKMLSLKVKFTEGGTQEYILLAGNHYRKGFALYSSADGKTLTFEDINYASGYRMTTGNAIYQKTFNVTDEVSTFLDKEFLLQISFEYLSNDGDGKFDDVQLGFYLNGKLYNNEMVTIPNCNMDNFGNYLNLYLGGADEAIRLREVTPENMNLTKITWSDFSRDGVPGVNRTFPLAPLDGKPFSYTLDKEGLTSLAATSFEAWITFATAGDSIYYGGTGSETGIIIAPLADGTMQISHAGMNIKEFPVILDSTIAGVNFLNEAYRLKITTEIADYDGDGTANDVQLGIWFNEKLYNNQYFYLNGCAGSFGNLLNVYPPKGGITLLSVGPVFVEDFENVTLSNFKDATGNAMEAKEYTASVDSDNKTYAMYDTEGNPVSSFDKKILSMKIKFNNDQANGRLEVAGTASGDSGFALYSDETGDNLIFEDVYENMTSPKCDVRFYSKTAGVSSFLNHEFLLQISFEYMDDDNTGIQDDVHLNFYFDGKLYNNCETVLRNCTMENLGNLLRVYFEENGGSVSLSEASPKYTVHPEKPEISVATTEYPYRPYFPDVARTEDGLFAAYYRAMYHAPKFDQAAVGSIYKVTGSKDGLTWSEPEEFIGEELMRESGLGIWVDRKGTSNSSDDVFYYNDDKDEYPETPYYYYNGAEKVRIAALPETCQYIVDARDPNLTRMKNGTLIFTFFTYLPDGAITQEHVRNRAYIMYSKDNGNSWSNPVVIKTDLLDLWSAKRGSIAEYSDGSLLIPLYGASSKVAADSLASYIHAKLNADGTWTFESDADSSYEKYGMIVPGAPGYDEVGLCTVSGDVTYALCRQTNELWVSEDKGKTWTLLYQISVPIGYLAQPTLTNVDGSDQIFATWVETASDQGRNVYGKIFDPSKGWTATEDILIYRNTNIQGEIGYPLGWQQDMGDPTGIQLENGNFFTIFYDSKFQCVGGKVMTMEELNVPAYKTLEEFSETFEDDAIGAYQSNDLIGYYSSTNLPEAWEVSSDESGNKFLAHQTTGWQDRRMHIDIENGYAVTLDVRMPQSQVYFDLHLHTTTTWSGAPGLVRITAVDEPDGAVSMTHINGRGVSQTFIANGATVTKVNNVLPVGSDAAWYTFKLLKYNDDVHMKIWAKGSEEPDAYQYVFSNKDFITSDDDILFRVADGAVHLDNIQLTKEEGLPLYITESFEDNEIGAYPNDDVIEHLSNGAIKTESETNENHILQYSSDGWSDNRFTVIPFKGEHELSFDFRLPTAQPTLAMNINGSGYVSMQLVAAEGSQKASLKFMDNKGNPFGMIVNGEMCNEVVDVVEVGEDAPWYTAKMTLLNGTLYLKIWVRDEAEPTTYQYVLGHSSWLNTNRMQLRIVGGTVELDDILVKAAKIHVKGTGYSGANDGISHNISVTTEFDRSVLYQWYRGGKGQENLIAGANQSTYAVQDATDNGTYYCRVKIQGKEAWTDAIQVSIVNYATMKISPVITDSIAMNYIATIDPSLLESGVTPYMTFEMEGKSLTKVEGTPVTEGSNVYTFKYSDIMMQNMAKAITATLVAGEYTKEYQYSVWDYCKTVLDETDYTKLDGLATAEDLAELKHLVVDLVQYGAKVQSYRGDSISDDLLLSNKLTDTYLAYDTDSADENLNSVTSIKGLSESQSGSAYKWTSATLLLTEQMNIRFRFTIAEGSTKNVVIKATIRGTTYTFQGDDIKKDSKYTNGYYIDFDNIMANEYDEAVQVTIYSEDVAVSATLTYSVNSYLCEMTGDNLALNDLLVAIHGFGTAAKLYQDQ